jgi:hypothetical protein
MSWFHVTNPSTFSIAFNLEKKKLITAVSLKIMQYEFLSMQVFAFNDRGNITLSVPGKI